MDSESDELEGVVIFFFLLPFSSFFPYFGFFSLFAFFSALFIVF